jgi:hypothetical protein
LTSFSVKDLLFKNMERQNSHYYLYGSILPLLVQVPVLLAWSFLPTSDLIAGRISFDEALDTAVSLLGFPGIGLAIIISGVIAVPFGMLQVLCARSLGRQGASKRMLFFIGMLNPANAHVVVLAVLIMRASFSG